MKNNKILIIIILIICILLISVGLFVSIGNKKPIDEPKDVIEDTKDNAKTVDPDTIETDENYISTENPGHVYDSPDGYGGE